MMIMNSVTHSYKVSWSHLCNISNPTPSDLVAKILKLNTNTPLQLTFLTRLKITIANLAVAIAFAIPVVQSIALRILLNNKKEIIREYLKNDQRVNQEYLDTLVNEIFEALPKTTRSPIEGVQKFLESRVKTAKEKISVSMQEVTDNTEFKAIFQKVCKEFPELSPDFLDSFTSSILSNNRKGIIREYLKNDERVNQQLVDVIANKILESLPKTGTPLIKSVRGFLKSHIKMAEEKILEIVEGIADTEEFGALSQRVYKEFSGLSAHFLDSLIKVPYVQVVILNVHRKSFSDIPFLPDVEQLARKGDLFLSRTSLERKIQDFFKEQLFILQDCLNSEIDDEDNRVSHYNHSYFSSEETSIFQENFHRNYQYFFELVKENCTTSTDKLANQFNFNTPIGLFFLKHLSLIHAKALLYKRYATFYPDTFNDDNFKNIYTSWRNSNERITTINKDVIDKFLKQKAQEESDWLLKLFWEQRNNPNQALVHSADFHSQQSIRFMINKIKFEYRQICAFLRENKHFILSSAWSHWKGKLDLISYEHFKEVFQEHSFAKKAIDTIEQRNDLAEDAHIQEEVKRFENHSEVTVAQFFSNLRIKIKIKKIIKKWKTPSTRDRYLFKLLKYQKKISSFNHSMDQIAPLVEEIHRETVFHLVASKRSSIRIKDLDERGREILKICRAMLSYLKKEEGASTRMHKILSRQGFQILTKQEILFLLCLSCTNLVVRKQLIENIRRRKNNFETRSRSGRPTASQFLIQQDITSILEQVKQLLSVEFSDLLPEDATMKADIQDFHTYLIETHW